MASLIQCRKRKHNPTDINTPCLFIEKRTRRRIDVASYAKATRSIVQSLIPIDDLIGEVQSYLLPNVDKQLICLRQIKSALFKFNSDGVGPKRFTVAGFQQYSNPNIPIHVSLQHSPTSPKTDDYCILDRRIMELSSDEEAAVVTNTDRHQENNNNLTTAIVTVNERYF
jgi:hypothetical protein